MAPILRRLRNFFPEREADNKESNGTTEPSEGQTETPPINSSQDTTRTFSSADVLRIFFVLSKALNRDVALQILETSAHAHSSHQVSYSERVLRVRERENGELLLRTQPLRVSSKGPQHSIKRITVEATGHDQGWASGEGSWTWYTVDVIALDRGNNPTSTSRKSIEFGRNLRAEGRDQVHTMTFSSHPEEGDQSFIGAVADGDCLEVRAHALYPGWVNHVKFARVTVDLAIC